MDKVAPFLQKDKGLDLKEHMVEIEEMAQLGADGNFDTLNCREYNMAEMAIKFIKHLCLLKSATRFKDVILSIFQKWIPVTTHSIVTDFAEPFFSFFGPGERLPQLQHLQLRLQATHAQERHRLDTRRGIAGRLIVTSVSVLQ